MPKILLVEDDPALQFTIQTALEENGYSVDAVSTTGDAIERLADQAYPIVVTDIYIDERTGLDVLDAAKRKDAFCCVILMTGRGTVETVIQRLPRPGQAERKDGAEDHQGAGHREHVGVHRVGDRLDDAGWSPDPEVFERVADEKSRERQEDTP